MCLCEYDYIPLNYSFCYIKYGIPYANLLKYIKYFTGFYHTPCHTQLFAVSKSTRIRIVRSICQFILIRRLC